jgi:hypothetical protein
MRKIEIDMSREWLIMLQDYCVRAESGEQIPSACVQAMDEHLSEISSTLKRAEINAKRSA